MYEELEPVRIEEERGEEVPPQKVDLAYLISVPITVPYDLQEKYFPFLDKIIHLANLKSNDILDLQDDYEIIRLEGIRMKRRYELKKSLNRQEQIRIRAYTNAALSLSRDGFSVKRLTAVHKHITYEDEHKKVGGFLGLFKRGGGYE